MIIDAARAESAARETPAAARSVLPFRAMLRFAPGTLIPAAAAVVSAAVFTRLLRPEAFGMYALATAAILLISAALVQWLIQGTERYLPAALDAAERQQITGAIVIGAAAAAGIWTAIGSVTVLLLLPRLDRGWHEVLAASAVVVLLLTMFQAALAVLRAELRSGRYSALQAAESVLRLVLGVVVVLLTFARAEALLWAWVIGLALLLPIAWSQVGAPGVQWLRQEGARMTSTLVRLWRYGLPMTGWFVASLLLHAADRYVIQIYRGAAEVGIYSASYTLVFGAVSTLAAPILLAAHPFLMRAWSGGEREGTAQVLSLMTRWLMIAGIVGTALVFVFARDIAAVLLGSQFVDGHRIMGPVAAGVMAWQVGLCAHKPLEFHERTGELFALCAAVAVVNLVLNLVFVPDYGYVAAAYTTTASYILYAVAAWLLGRRYLRWSTSLAPIAGAAVLTIAGAVAAVGVRSQIGGVGGAAGGFIAGVVIMSLVGGFILYRLAGQIRHHFRSGTPGRVH